MRTQSFSEITHCGGKFTIKLKENKIQFGYSHANPTPMAAFCVIALESGRPLCVCPITRMPNIPGAYPIFVASDSLGLFGNTCPNCNQYWRSEGVPTEWPTTCPYCGIIDEGHMFLTEGQREYISACCVKISEVLEIGIDGDYSLDMDQIADEVLKGKEKPAFFYTEESQQNKFKCIACERVNDIIGRYGFCSSCGTDNGIQEIVKDLNAANKGTDFSATLKSHVSSFDSYARHLVRILTNKIPMTTRRKKLFEKMKFHNIKPKADELKKAFDIDLFKGFKSDEIIFSNLMFHRRHVYEHNGGEVDQKYINDAGDDVVRLKEHISESKDSVIQLSVMIHRLATNIHEGYHSIFPNQQQALKCLGKQKKVPALQRS